MSLKLGTTTIAGISTKTKYNAHNLLDFKWSDHIISDISWLRADTFSWQNGSVYVAVYNYLASSIQGATTKTEQGITFYECTNGLRIALADQENNVLSAYNTDGVAWYYILDTDNQRFKLPRTKYNFVGLRGEVGKFVDESLPNITGTTSMKGLTGMVTNAVVSGSFQIGINSYSAAATTTSQTSYDLSFDASRSSSTYQDNAPVQQKSTQMYLYFYVGEYDQTAIEQTAGLNAELFNGKVDKVGESCIVKTTYVNGTSGYRIWSDGYCVQWGRITPTSAQAIALVKAYKDTNYTVLATSNHSDTANRRWASAGITNASTIWVMTSSSSTGASATQATWKTSGYLAEDQY